MEGQKRFLVGIEIPSAIVGPALCPNEYNAPWLLASRLLYRSWTKPGNTVPVGQLSAEPKSTFYFITGHLPLCDCKLRCGLDHMTAVCLHHCGCFTA